MDLSQLITFVRVAELGSLSRASSHLHVVQPALSRQIRLLEEELGAALFTRHGRGMSLTPAGRDALEHATRVLAEVDALRGSVSRTPTRLSGLVRLGMPPTANSLLAVPLMTRIRADQPGLQMRLSSAFSGHLIDWLQRGELDLAISYDPPPTRALKVIPILVEQLHLVSADPARFGQSPLPFAALAHEQLVLPSPGHGLRAIFDSCARQAGISIAPPIEADSFGTIIDLTRAGFGATLLPRAAIQGHPAAAELHHVPLVDPAPCRRLVICLAADRRVDPATSYLCQVIERISRQLMDEGRWDGEPA